MCGSHALPGVARVLSCPLSFGHTFSLRKTPHKAPIFQPPIAVETKFGRVAHPKTAIAADFIGRKSNNVPPDYAKKGACPSNTPVPRPRFSST